MDDHKQRHPLGYDIPAGGVWESDADDIIRYASASMAEVAGVPVEEIIGCKIPDDFSPEAMAEFYPLYERTKKSGVPSRYSRIHVLTPGARDAFQSGWLIPLGLSRGTPGGICCTVLDATGTVAAEQELLDNRERWRTMAWLAPVGVFETDAEGKCLFVNRKWCELTGLTPEQAEGRGWERALRAADRERVAAAWYSMSSGNGDFDEEYGFERPDGQISWVRGVSGALKDDAGTVTGYLGVLSDITERRRIVAALEAERARAEQYLDIADLIAIALDETGRVVRANRRARDLFAAPGDPLVGTDWFSTRVPEAVRAQVREVFALLMGQPAQAMESYENPILLPDGTKRTIEWHNSPVLDEDGIARGCISLGLDVTARRQTEILRIESEAKDRFLANMSHELRTPLNSILGFSGILLQGIAGPVSEEQARQLTMIKSAGDDLLQLVNDLLDVEQVAVGEVEILSQETRWCEFIQEVTEQVRPQFDEAGLKLDVHCEGEPVVMTDRRRVKQILVNLLTNALKFTPSGRVIVEGGCVDDEVVARVRDTGIGISESEVERVFELYHQAPRSDVAKSRGAGLGLPLSRSYARLLGGDLVVESREGHGSLFTLRIPRVSVREQEL